MRFVFIAKHRSIWPVAWLCEALDVSRSGFHAWPKTAAITLAPGTMRCWWRRSTGASRAATAPMVPAASGKMFWQRVFSAAFIVSRGSCARTGCVPGRAAVGCQRTLVSEQPCRTTSSTAPSRHRPRTKSGSPTSPTSGPPKDGSTSPPSSTCSHGVSSAGQ